jgi:hypothetical protein
VADPSAQLRTVPRVAGLAERFSCAPEFTSSPLYRALGRAVAEDERLIRLASRARAGQYPTFLFFAAVHYLLLAGADHELASFYPSVVGAEARPPQAAGPALASFCVAFERELAELLETRLVQTNSVRRALALRLGLAAVGRRTSSPVHLIEIGASAGILLRFDRYGYSLGGRRFGDPRSPVQIGALWLGETAVPDLDALPPLASVAGVDLQPLSATDPDDRRWLEALVWPENRLQADLLHHALEIVAADPPTILAGDAVDICPRLARALPPGEARVAFQAATRMHVPEERRDDFDEAIAALGHDAPLYRLALEDGLPDPDPRPQPARPGGALTLHSPSGPPSHLAIVDGHLDWIEPLDP